MNRFLYSLLLYLITPLVIGRLFWRSRKAPAYGQRVMERFGRIQLPRSEKPLIWVHSVSVGETIASAPLVRELKNQYPNHRILVTTMTPTGSEQVRKLHGESVEHVYVCYDLPGAVRRFLTHARPVLAVVIDTELWPNTIAACHNRNIPIMVANARLSERSARGYARFGNLSRRMLEKVSMVAAQSQETANRFLELGIPKLHVNVTGSIKFDLQVDTHTLLEGKTLRLQWQSSMGSDIRVLAAASTHEGEDQPVVDAFKAIASTHPEVRLLLIPRHPERFNDVFQLIKANELSVARQSEGSNVPRETRVILGDTMGEMMKFLAASDLAFVGGSLVPVGGHNMLEPAALGLPVLSGPHIFNFEEISHALVKAGGMKIIESSNELAETVTHLLEDKGVHEQMSHAAEGFISKNRGALAKVMDQIERLLPSS